jgi:hypothetical protein
LTDEEDGEDELGIGDNAPFLDDDIDEDMLENDIDDRMMIHILIWMIKKKIQMLHWSIRYISRLGTQLYWVLGN